MIPRISNEVRNLGEGLYDPRDSPRVSVRLSFRVLVFDPYMSLDVGRYFIA
jgi:hypothetical protein